MLKRKHDHIAGRNTGTQHAYKRLSRAVHTNTSADEAVSHSISSHSHEERLKNQLILRNGVNKALIQNCVRK